MCCIAEQFENAVNEYSEALSTLAAFLPPYHRQLSELHMLIALALDFVPDAVGRAVEHAEKAKEVLSLKVAQLEGLDKQSELDKKELVQIRELMGDVDMKVSRCADAGAGTSELTAAFVFLVADRGLEDRPGRSAQVGRGPCSRGPHARQSGRRGQRPRRRQQPQQPRQEEEARRCAYARTCTG